MTSIGGLASCETLTCNILIADEIDRINTSQNINITKDGTVRWSLGLNENNDFILQNEVAEVGPSIIANNDTGHVQILGGGGEGVENLTDLSDVDMTDISDNYLMYYDSSTNNFKFTDTIDVSAISFPTNIQLNTQNASSPITIGYIGSQNQGENSVAIGNYAGQINIGKKAIGIGEYASLNGSKDYSIAIGFGSGMTNLESLQ